MMLSRVLLCTVALLALAHLASAGTTPSCLIGAARLDCGYGDQGSCEQNNCCWNPVPEPSQRRAMENMTEKEKMQDVVPPHLLGGTPWCFSKQSIVGGYEVASINPLQPGPDQNPGWEIVLALYDGSGVWGTDIPTLNVLVVFETVARIRVKITDAVNQRWEIPSTVLPFAPVDSTINVNELNYAFSYTSQPFGFAITRVEDNEVIFNTTAPTPQLDGAPLFNGLVFTDQYIEISTQLPDYPAIYGLGEKVTSLQLKTNGQPITMWARDAPSPPDENIYGTHPVYFENRQTAAPAQSTKTHGVWLRNSNGMDVLIYDGVTARQTYAKSYGIPMENFEGEAQQQYGYLTYRVTGGVLDFFIYVGSGATSRPEAITQQYHASVGFPHMPPLWALGFHQCRWGYPNLQAVETMVQKYAQNEIPLDTAWTDIDYMQSYEDFSTDSVNFPTAAMAQFISQLHKQGQHYVVIIDPAIHNRTGYEVFESGLQADVFIKQSNGNLFVGKVWPGYTAFPSWWSSNTASWWEQQIVNFRDAVPVDGLWIDMNEASNFCSGDCDAPTDGVMRNTRKAVATESVLAHRRGNKQSGLHGPNFQPNNPPYRINNTGAGSPLNTLTIDADSLHGQGFIEYDVHNLYGFGESIATNAALEGSMNTRSLVISRSTFSGSGAHTGHWLGDNWSTFESMSYSIAGILAMNFFGIPLVGADICGFNGNTNEELCARWMALGSFYPFSRNHNTKGADPQEPYTWPSVAAVSKMTLGARYSLLHVYNTLFFEANQNGGTVARPLFFAFPDDAFSWNIETQFLIGNSIMITPVLTQGATSVQIYFPVEQCTTWYDFWSQTIVNLPASGWLTVAAPTSTIPVHILGGTILPIQQPELTTAAQLMNPITLVVAQNACGSANGTLFMDDGLTLNVGSNSLQASFAFASNTLQYTISSNSYGPAAQIQIVSVAILGVSSSPSSVTVNGATVSSFTLDPDTLVLSINVSLPLNQPFTLVLG